MILRTSSSSLRLPLLVEGVLELEDGVEVVLDRALAAAGDEDRVGDARQVRLLDHVLDQRLVDEREHLLRGGLGRRQEPRPEPADGKDGLHNAHETLLRACGARRTALPMVGGEGRGVKDRAPQSADRPSGTAGGTVSRARVIPRK